MSALLPHVSSRLVVNKSIRTMYAKALRATSNGVSGEMTLDEIKAELDVRGVDYSDCFSKSELAERLATVRKEGKADPKIIDTFNEMKFSEIPDEDYIMDLTAKDGTLPGGMSPQIIKALASDPEIVQLLRDPKMQAIMKDMMVGGPEGVKKYMSDPDSIMLLQKLSFAMQRIIPQGNGNGGTR